MNDLNHIELGNVLLSCATEKMREAHQFIPVHVIGYMVTGDLEVYADGKKQLLSAGHAGFFKGNQLGRFLKLPPTNGLFKSVSVSFDQQTLQDFSKEYSIHADKPYTGEVIKTFKPNAMFDNFFRGFDPYFDPANRLDPALIKLKVKEILLLMLQADPDLKNLLFDFRQPGKIDLEGFMEQNYMFNVPMSTFAQYTGRSLAAFKRDFNDKFKTSPGKWLQQKRLEEARYLIKEKGRKVSDIYLELGFEDLSHFSFAFKKAFGVAPSMA